MVSKICGKLEPTKSPDEKDSIDEEEKLEEELVLVVEQSEGRR
jgi:hypothetical protein